MLRRGAELTDEYCTDFAAQAPVSTFTDDQGWVPGLEFRDGEACSTATATARSSCRRVGNAPYTTRLVDAERQPLTGVRRPRTSASASRLGSGNPADAGVGYGTVVEVKKAVRRQHVAA